VVAGEVKQLANQTARSTEEINRHISEVRAATGASVGAVSAIERTITEMDVIAGTIASAVEEQGAATAEIARNVAQTAEAANEITSRIGEVSTEAQDTGQHAADVQIDAAGLAELVSELRRTVVRVIRTSSADVDRRHVARTNVDMPCQLSVAGYGEANGRVTDLSESGARLECAMTVPVGAAGTLGLQSTGLRLPFVTAMAAYWASPSNPMRQTSAHCDRFCNALCHPGRPDDAAPIAPDLHELTKLERETANAADELDGQTERRHRRCG
jgi:methyl-accepting chemotaxis protein